MKKIILLALVMLATAGVSMAQVHRPPPPPPHRPIVHHRRPVHRYHRPVHHYHRPVRRPIHH